MFMHINIHILLIFLDRPKPLDYQNLQFLRKLSNLSCQYRIIVITHNILGANLTEVISIRF